MPMTTGTIHINPHVVIAMKKQTLQARQRRMPQEAVAALAQMQPPALTSMDTVDDGRSVTLIGRLTRRGVYDPVLAALTMVREGAHALSFYTDHAIYDDDYEDCFLVTRAVPRTPVLYANYLLNEYGVIQARVSGASGAFLYSDMLSAEKLHTIATAAHRWRLSVFLQASTLAHVEQAYMLNPHVICYGSVASNNIHKALDELATVRAYTPHYAKLMLMHTFHYLDDIERAIAAGVRGVIVSDQLFKPETAPRLRALLKEVNGA